MKKVTKQEALKIGQVLSGDYVNETSEAKALLKVLEAILSGLVASEIDWDELANSELLAERLKHPLSEVAASQNTNGKVPPPGVLYEIATHLIECRTIFK